MQHATTRPARPRVQKSKPTSKSHPIRKTKLNMTTTKKSPRTTIITTSSVRLSTLSTLPRTIKLSSKLSFKMKKLQFVNPTSRSLSQFSTTQPQTHTISLEQVLTDLQLESLIPAIQSPPELQSLLLHRSKHLQEKPEITLFHLVILSPGDFRQLFPNDIHRNRLKEHLRTLIGGKPLASDGVEPISFDEFNNIVNQFVQSQHFPETESTQHTKIQFVDAAVTPMQDNKQQITPDSTATTASPPTPQSTTSTTLTSAESTSHDASTDQAHLVPESTVDTASMAAEKSLAEETLKISIQRLKMPSFFDAMKTGSIQEWHVKVGEHFTRGQVLCDIDTEIAELSFEAPEPGHLSEILVGTGSPVNVGDAIAVMRYQEDH